jgi:murein DD-endopeptidase MepM/ murein hydrolase activator NlpD
MMRTRVAAASIAIALLPVWAIAGAAAPSSYAASSDDAPEITWAQVAAAQASVAATKALAKEIKAQVAALQTSVKAAQDDADAKGDVYAKAQAAYDNQEFIAEKLQAQADAAQKKADAAKKRAGEMIAQAGRAGGSGDLTASLLGDSSSASTLLSRLGYANQIGERFSQVYAKALQLEKNAQSITKQANAAAAAAAKLKDVAQTAFAAAQAAAGAASDALKAARSKFADLSAKLTKLEGAADQALKKYNDSLVAKWGPGAAGVVSASGWANPANGYLGDRFGMRYFPLPPHGWSLHTGQDISGTGCGAPIYAAHSGTVTFAGRDGDLGNFIEIDNGGGITTGYGHIIAGGILVRIGQHVGPGQNIAKTGRTGAATGCHLHFMVRINGALTDPLPFMRDRGVTLG